MGKQVNRPWDNDLLLRFRAYLSPRSAAVRQTNMSIRRHSKHHGRAADALLGYDSRHHFSTYYLICLSGPSEKVPESLWGPEFAKCAKTFGSRLNASSGSHACLHVDVNILHTVGEGQRLRGHTTDAETETTTRIVIVEIVVTIWMRQHNATGNWIHAKDRMSLLPTHSAGKLLTLFASLTIQEGKRKSSLMWLMYPEIMKKAASWVWSHTGSSIIQHIVHTEKQRLKSLSEMSGPRFHPSQLEITTTLTFDYTPMNVVITIIVHVRWRFYTLDL